MQSFKSLNILRPWQVVRAWYATFSRFQNPSCPSMGTHAKYSCLGTPAVDWGESIQLTAKKKSCLQEKSWKSILLTCRDETTPFELGTFFKNERDRTRAKNRKNKKVFSPFMACLPKSFVMLWDLVFFFAFFSTLSLLLSNRTIIPRSWKSFLSFLLSHTLPSVRHFSFHWP